LALIAVVSLSEIGFTHYLWIEKADKGEAKVFFGEVQEGVKEKSGGRLDDIAAPLIQAVDASGKTKKLKFDRREDHFKVRGANEDVLLVSEASHPVQDLREYGIGVVKPMFYARIERTGIRPKEPALDLDILPTDAPNEYRVFFKKQPASGFKVMIYAPNLWMQELKTNESGVVKIETPWPGQYVLDVVHKETSVGTYKENKYEAIRHRGTYTLMR
jgi:hypothetical protein